MVRYNRLLVISTDSYLNRVYNRDSYNCLHFARDVWFDLTGLDIEKKLEGIFGLVVKDRQIRKELVKSFDVSSKPFDPSLVVMQHPFKDPHIGVYLRGKILHLNEEGAEYFPVEVATRGFSSVRYFRPC